MRAVRYAPSGERYLQRRSSTNCSSPCTSWAFTLYPFAGYELEGTISSSGNHAANYQKARQRLGGWGLWLSGYGDMAQAVWLHTDRLGSIVAKTRADGAVVMTPNLVPAFPERHGYDAFGKPRLGDWRDGGGQAQSHMPGYNGQLNSKITPRGFTEHEHLDRYQLIHMNGRAYDPLLGRFLSVDPIVQFPANSQSLNPYSYILNNPLAGTDPTGYACSTGTKISGQVVHHPVCTLV